MKNLDAIDLLTLYAKGDLKLWNSFLNECFLNLDVNRLADTRRRLQAGMDNAAKKKMNSEEIILFYIRLNRSIENTAKAIVRKRNPLFSDKPNNVKLAEKEKEIKSRRQLELAEFFKKSSY